METSPQKCLICRKETHVSVKLPQTRRNYLHNCTIFKWKLLTAESLCMLFGLPINHAFVTRYSGVKGNKEEEPLLCSQCLQDMSDVHFIYWQLHNLEMKLSKLQRLLFERLNLSWEKGTAKEDETLGGRLGDVLESWFNDVKSGLDHWPKGIYISKWKEAVKNTEDVDFMTNDSLMNQHLDPPPPKIEIKVDPDFDEDYFPDENIGNGDSDMIMDPVSKRKKRKKQKSRVLHHYSTDSNGKYLCTEDPLICRRTYDTKKLLTNHVKNFHEGRNHICDQEGCVEKFKSELRLVYHKKKVHNVSVETTIKPNRWIIDKDELLNGEQSGEIFKCIVDPSICNRMFRRLKDLNTHIQQFHEGRNFCCDEDGCNEKFKSKGMLSSHKRNAHCSVISKLITKNTTGKDNEEEKELNEDSSKVCDICGVTVSTKHMRSHFKVNHMDHARFKCGFCSMDFSSADLFRTHENLHSQLSESMPFTCVAPGCTEILTNSYDLKKHVNMNHLSSGLKCEICGIMKHNQFLLQRHLKGHENQTNGSSSSVICDECGKSYVSEISLKKHKRDFHMGKRFPCDNCSRVYKRSKDLLRHKRSHSSERPFKCLICSKGFSHQENLRKHEEIHSGTKKYECHLCGKRFRQCQNLKQHLRTQAHRPKI